MAAFDIEISSPFATGFTGGLGGPGQGGHVSPDWYIQYGMDLGALTGTIVHAAFDAHITRFAPHDPATDSGKVYGAQIFMRSPNEQMGAFYTHITGTPADLAIGSSITRGQPLGSVYEFGGISPHLHLALVEIIGGAPNGQYQGVDLYQFFLDTANTDTATSVTFHQDGTPPEPGDNAGPATFDLSTIRGIQSGLSALGYDPGRIDGIDGPATQAAVSAFQSDQGFDPDGRCEGATLDALRAALMAAGFEVA
jgi:hypothetical protein